ncbi:MAG TPA: NADH-quinone oxidoreductase subunit J [Anaerolineales bacterium]|nr:NADH-quinone oxidoreductase subunit J [Anaerolineales bacterium]
MTTDLWIFFGLATIAIVSAASMLISRNAVYSALFLVLNFVTVAVMYLLLHAAFIALVQVTVYAGAIMVLFLFVIMLLGAERVGNQRSLKWQQPAAAILGLGLLGEMVYVFFAGSGGQAAPAAVLGEAFGSPNAVGTLLFSEYLLPFEVTSVVLLAAMVGAIVLTREEKRAREARP